MKVKCPSAKEWVEFEVERDDDTEFRCPKCSGDIYRSESGRYIHQPGKWVKCPLNGGLTFVWTDEECMYECAHCDEKIEVIDGEAHHDRMIAVKCLEQPDNESWFNQCRDEELQCPYCGRDIIEIDGRVEHEAIANLANCADVLYRGRENADLVLVHGFLNDSDMDYANWKRQILSCGWRGSIWGWQWPAGSVLGRLPLAAFWAILRNPQNVKASLFVAAITALMAKIDFTRAEEESVSQGDQLARSVAHSLNAGRHVTIVGYSLGCRVVEQALRKLGQWGYKNGVDVHLCAGAVTQDVSWRSKAVNRLYNYQSENDLVLRYIFTTANLYSGHSIGVHGIPRGKAPRVENIIAEHDGRQVGHLEYDRTFRSFAQFG